jgi:hypothetical protein
MKSQALLLPKKYVLDINLMVTKSTGLMVYLVVIEASKIY